MALVVAALLVVFAAGCSLLPGRYTAEQLERVGSELGDADSIYAELGPPDLRREDSRIWIYAWEDPVPYPSRSFIVLEFDADGRLSNREVALEVKPSQGGLSGLRQSARYCTPGGTCVEHGIATDAGISFDDSFSAVTVTGAARARMPPPQPAANECLLVIWPGTGWNQSHSSIPPPDGVAVSIDGSSKWTYFRWLPLGAYARIVLPAGEHALSVRDPMWDARTSDQTTPDEDQPWEDPWYEDLPWWVAIVDALLSPSPVYGTEESDRKPRTVTVQCRAGEPLYLAIDATFEGKGQHWFPIELRAVSEAEAEALMAQMTLLLPPDH